ncbi:MAG: SRPBCC domain-containing protein [Planctomycetota bacterium]|nr:SRPBCC domain-containing protein [Planctomycetota bacterium]
MSTRPTNASVPLAPHATPASVDAPQEPVRTLRIERRIEIDAPPEVVFDAILEEMGPGSVLPDGRSMQMRVEAWPGGRWFRDLGDGRGHLWGHVQVIKPPTLLELCGPMFMSYPAANFVQYRVTQAPGGGSVLELVHRAMGLLLSEHTEGVAMGWEHGLGMIRSRAERAAGGGPSVRTV